MTSLILQTLQRGKKKMFFNNAGIQRQFNKVVFEQYPRKDQDEMLQQIYDSGYSVKDIAKLLNMNPQTLYSRIDAHRGRGPQLNPTN
jgi:transposase-like protein